MRTEVSIVNVNDFKNIKEAVIHAVGLIEDNLPFDFIGTNYILLKPNLLSTNRNACTQPQFIEGVVAYLEATGVSPDRIRIGDSPGQFQKTGTFVAKGIGLWDTCVKRGIQFIDFESGQPVKENIDKAVLMKEFYVSKPVKDCDILINLPRLKSHAETTITGAIKNYYGIIPGGLKAKMHLMGRNAHEFGSVITDNFSWVVKNKPKRLTVYDLHTIMEGPKGPVAGSMSNWNLILAGTDELALDIVALEIGGRDGVKDVPHLREAFQRGLGVGHLDDIEIKGMPLADAQNQAKKFNIPSGLMSRSVSLVTSNLAYSIMRKVPVLDRELCTKCGECSKICPKNVISFSKGHYPIFGRKGCISCLCCMEMCTFKAIDIKRRGFAGLFDPS
jgi:uncharacterized protein (DUF362 family)/NAD-dependent dihydropyrimidine dehydrogenase PreA subunit